MRTEIVDLNFCSRCEAENMNKNQVLRLRHLSRQQIDITSVMITRTFRYYGERCCFHPQARLQLLATTAEQNSWRTIKIKASRFAVSEWRCHFFILIKNNNAQYQPKYRHHKDSKKIIKINMNKYQTAHKTTVFLNWDTLRKR